MQASIFVILIVFYAGAVCATGTCWFGVWRGTLRYSALRDLTGIADRAVLRRLFGLTRPDGAYRVSLAAVLRHRRAPGVILTDLPVHALFLAALSWAAFHVELPAAAAIVAAAGAHGLLLGGMALVVLIGRSVPSSRRA